MYDSNRLNLFYNAEQYVFVRLNNKCLDVQFILSAAGEPRAKTKINF